MLDKNQLASAIQLLRQAKSVLVLLPANPLLESVAAGLAAYLSLKKSQRQVQIGCVTPMSVAFNRLFGIDKIKTRVGSRNLIISFPYAEESIEKVSYHVADRKFNLVVIPKQGFSPLDPEKVNYTNSGIEADVVAVIGAEKWEDLGALYADERETLGKIETINVDIHPSNFRFGTCNLADPQASSCSEIIGKVLKGTGLSVKGDIATNLVAGIESATNNLQFKVSADTFELLAWLLHQGGQRGHLLGGTTPLSPGSPTQAPAPNFGQRPSFPSFPGLATFPSSFPNPPAVPNQVRPSVPTGLGAFVSNQSGIAPTSSAPAATPSLPINQESEATDTVQEDKDNGEGQAAPSPDWYQPKIYKGTRV